MWILPLVGYLGVIVGFAFLTLAIASGLYYLSELVEEHTVLARRLLSRLISGIIIIQIFLFLVDRFPFSLSVLSIISHLVYASNLRRFPIVKLSDPLFILSCILVGLNHWLWFRHFSNPLPTSRAAGNWRQPYQATNDMPNFTEVASYFGLCVWLVPFALFVSLSAGENVLPSMGSEYATGERVSTAGLSMSTDGKAKNKGMAKALVDGVRDWVKKNGKGAEPDSDGPDTVQGFSFDDAVPAEPPILGSPLEKQPPKSPIFPSSPWGFSTDTNQGISTIPEHGQFAPQHSKVISGPTNGAVIQDVGAWGNKASAPPTSTKEKKRSIWNFRTRSSIDIATQLQQAGHESPTGQMQGSVPSDRKDFVRPVFGIPLAEAVQYCAPQGVDVNLPAVVYRCIEYLNAKGAASEEGIFRLSGSNLVVKSLKERFNTEGDVDFLSGDQYYDVHAVASLFKQYLRELPDTVLTRELHLEFLRVLELDERQKKIAAFNFLVHRLPKPNLALLRVLSQFLIEIVNNSDVNKMTVRNVGIVFAPTLNIPAPVFSMFLTDYDSIFDDIPGPGAMTAELTVDNSGATDSLRSPRRQVFSEIPTPSYNRTTFQRQDSFPGSPFDDPRVAHDTGFAPVQPSYQQRHTSENYNYAPTNQMLNPENPRFAKAKRRESSLLFMDQNNQHPPGPTSRDDQFG